MVLAFTLGLYFLFAFALSITYGGTTWGLPPTLYGISTVYGLIVIVGLVGYLLHKHESEKQ
jgi:hypothetical protein